MPSSRSTSSLVFRYVSSTCLMRRGRDRLYRGRVPMLLVERLGKTEVSISTQARDSSEALRAAVQIGAAIEAEWRKLLAGSDTAPETADVTFATALASASRSRGVGVERLSQIAWS